MSAGRESGLSGWGSTSGWFFSDASPVIGSSRSDGADASVGDVGWLVVLRVRVRFSRSVKPVDAVALAVLSSCWADA